MGGASIIGIVNQKGGTGKTTSCVNLGADLAHEGKRVLLVDCDPQGSLTISLGHPQPDALSNTLADQMAAVLTDKPIDPGGVLHHEEGVDLLPANISLAGMEVSLVNAMSRETTLSVCWRITARLRSYPAGLQPVSWHADNQRIGGGRSHHYPGAGAVPVHQRC